MKMLVHAFIISCVNYCNAVLVGSSKSTTDTLQRVLNAAARLVTNTDKYDRGLSSLLHDQLHWLKVPERIEYRLAVMFGGQRSDVFERPLHSGHRCQQLANQQQLTVPCCRRITFGYSVFSVAGPMVWNSHRLSFAICLLVLVFLGTLLRQYCLHYIIASSAVEMYA